ncbi:hypothetical protein ACFE04_022631 [Oxalis oulophora]
MAMGSSSCSSSSYFWLPRPSSSSITSSRALFLSRCTLINRRELCTATYGRPWKFRIGPSAKTVPQEMPWQVKKNTNPPIRSVPQETSHVSTRVSPVIDNSASWLEAANECRHKKDQVGTWISYSSQNTEKLASKSNLVVHSQPTQACTAQNSRDEKSVGDENVDKLPSNGNPNFRLREKSGEAKTRINGYTTRVNVMAHSQPMQTFTPQKSRDETMGKDEYVRKLPSNGNTNFHPREMSGEAKTNINGYTQRANTTEKFTARTAAYNVQPAGVVNYDEKVSGIHQRLHSIYNKVLVVDNIAVAKEVVKMLTGQYRHLVHACDTEVANINVKKETPVNHGEVTCFSIYSGSEANYGNGKSCIWVDVLDGGGKDILAVFAPFFEDESIKKVWHNYSFDAHIVENSGLKLSGFHADTMHMARLWNSSRKSNGGYSLAALTADDMVMRHAKLDPEEKIIGKISMKTIFGKNKKKKDGSDGKTVTIPPVEELQREERKSWICYSSLDAISTLKLYESLKKHLSDMPWKLHGQSVSGTMFDFYMEYWLPFGELLVQMETEGMLVDRGYLAEIEKVAKSEQEIAVNRFRNWASKYCPDAKLMNVGSDTQVRQLFFGGIQNSKDSNEFLPEKKVFKVPNVDNFIKEGKKTAAKFRDIELQSIGVILPAETYTASGWPSTSGPALKTLAGKVSADYVFLNDDDDSGDDLETSPEPEEESIESKKDEDYSDYGTALRAFKDKEEGKEACHAIAALVQVCSIDSLISNFILPLQGSNISGENGRVHCSLNINTETGRLSARRPNLQNQPALEKDRYKIRQAFIAAPGNSLIVADYGQLELRILAHLADCKSMLEAFKAGGDFHSRTAMNMYPHIREALEQKKVILEWDPQPGEDRPPVPLLKDAFGSERRKAKMLNFSIAYGKTPMGLAKDWKVSVEEAKQTVDLWYNERQEVLKWQQIRKVEAIRDRCVYTLLGRARRFPSPVDRRQKSHIERAAINTPVQGSAADVAMCAMLQITKNERLKELGWKLLLQVHDEVILEGPTESAEIAKAIVVDCMEKPFFDGVNFLKVDLSVDAKCEKNWVNLFITPSALVLSSLRLQLLSSKCFPFSLYGYPIYAIRLSLRAMEQTEGSHKPNLYPVNTEEVSSP